MALELIPPGKRKNNPFFLVRGTLGGRSIEVSTKTRDEAAAQRFKAKLEIKLVKDRLPGPGETVSFRRAAELYFASKALPVADERRIQLVVDYIDPPRRNTGGERAKRRPAHCGKRALYPCFRRH